MRRLLFMLALVAASVPALPLYAQSDDDRLAFHDVSDAQTQKAAFDTLDGYLERIGSSAKVVSCRPLLWSRPGTVEWIYAGDCTLSNRAVVAMCGDTGVGDFALSWGFGVNKPRLIELARANCAGG